ncbi:hypothetical protein cypCar_00036667, partial [Cyprinus carpio]
LKNAIGRKQKTQTKGDQRKNKIQLKKDPFPGEAPIPLKQLQKFQRGEKYKVYFSLHLSQFGPYRLDYSRNGWHLLVGGKKGHVACIDWQSKCLMCEMNVMETVNGVKYMVTSGLDRKLKVYQNVLGSSPVSKPYMAHRLRGQIWGLAYCPFEDVLGIGHGEGFTSMIVPGAGEPNFDALDTNPYRSSKQRQEWEVKALLEKMQPELIGLDPGQLSKVDQASFEQRHKEQVEALGFDPLAKDKFKPKTKKKGRSSAGAIEKRKRKVAHEDQRVFVFSPLFLSCLCLESSPIVCATDMMMSHVDGQDVIQQTVQERTEREKELKEKSKEKKNLENKTTLDRFRK